MGAVGRPANSGSMKPGERRVGRKKGVPNKFSKELKDMILQALSDAGGVGYLKKRAEDSPGAFMALLGRVLPLQVTGKDDAPLIPGTINFVIRQQDGSDNQT